MCTNFFDNTLPRLTYCPQWGVSESFLSTVFSSLFLLSVTCILFPMFLCSYKGILTKDFILFSCLNGGGGSCWYYCNCYSQVSIVYDLVGASIWCTTEIEWLKLYKVLKWIKSIELINDEHILLQVCVFFFQVNLLTPYLICSQGD